MEGQLISSIGKRTHMQLGSGTVSASRVTEIQSHGYDDASPAEAAGSAFLSQLLEGKISIDGNDFLRRIYFPTTSDKEDLLRERQSEVPDHMYSCMVNATLNTAQASVAKALLSPEYKFRRTV